MKPSKELLETARNKAANLGPSCAIRLTGDASSYWLLNLDGKLYIGTLNKEENKLGKFFANRRVYVLDSKSLGAGEFQRLESNSNL